MVAFLGVAMFQENVDIWEGSRDVTTVSYNEELSGILCYFQMSPGHSCR